jgi:hypothetical protein
VKCEAHTSDNQRNYIRNPRVKISPRSSRRNGRIILKLFQAIVFGDVNRTEFFINGSVLTGCNNKIYGFVEELTVLRRFRIRLTPVHRLLFSIVKGIESKYAYK